ncbi:Ulp1 family isopeptidase [Mesorhizobium amorphae]|nr:Ulp1 family isopeptidase [Mesorhizobium amorphae]
MQRQQAAHAGHNGFEQHLLREARQADAASVARIHAPRDRFYPRLSDKDRCLIDAAIKAEVARRDLKGPTSRGYAAALRRLADDLGSQGKTLSALDHQSLIAYAKSFFAHDGSMVAALTVLRKHRDPGAPADGRQRNDPPVEDKNLIERVVQAAAADRGWLPSTAEQYDRTLRRLATSLGPGQTITALDHNSLVAHVKSFGGRDKEAMGAALTVLREYREPGILADRRPPHHGSSGADPVAGVHAPRDRFYPHLSDSDRSLIDAAIKAEVARRDLKGQTPRGYTAALRRLGNDLGSQGKSLSTLDHESLVAYAKSFFSHDGSIVAALMLLRKHRDPSAPADGRPRNEPSVEDRNLIEQAVQAAAARRGWLPSTAEEYDRTLRRLTKSLGPGQTITALGHNSLVAHVKSFGDRDKLAMGALTVLQEYRGRGTLADRRPPSMEGGRLIDDVARVSGHPETTPANGSRQADDQPDRSRSSFNSAELWEGVDQAGQLPADSWGTANFWQGVPSPPYSPAGAVDQPSPAVPSPGLAVNPEEVLRGADQPEQLRPAKRQRTLSNPQGDAIERQLSAIGNSGGRVLQAPIHQLASSSREAQPIMQGSGQDYIPAPHTGGGGAILGASALRPDRSTTVCVGGDKRPLYSEDASLMEGLRAALIARGAKDGTATRHVNCLLNFSRWLVENDKQGIAPRLHDKSLDDDVKELERNGGSSSIVPALKYLKTYQAGAPAPTIGRTVLNPYPDDAALIKEYKSAAPASGLSPDSASNYASALGSFGHYLRQNNMPGIAARLHDKSLDEDVIRYPGSYKRVVFALAHLRKSLPRSEALEPERQIATVPRAVGSPVALPGEGYDQDQLWEMLEEAGPPSSLAPTARHSQAPDFGEAVRHLNWRHAHQRAPDELIAALDRSNLMPNQEVQLTSFLIDGERYTAGWLPLGGRPRTPLNPRGVAIRLRYRPEAAPLPNSQPGNPTWPQLFDRTMEPPRAVSARAEGAAGLNDVQPVHHAEVGPMSEAASAATPRAPSDIYGGLDSLVHLPVTPQELRDDAYYAPGFPRLPSDGQLIHHAEVGPMSEAASAATPRAPSDIYGGLDSLVHLPVTPQELRDDAHYAPGLPRLPSDVQLIPHAEVGPMSEAASAATPRAQSDIYGGLDSLVHLPVTPQELRDDAHYAPGLPPLPSDVQLVHHAEVGPMSEAASAATPRAQSDIYGGLDSLVHLPVTPQELRDDAHYAPELPRPPSDAQVGALHPAASLHDGGWLELGASEWLADKHILADYALLAQDLQRDNPDLAARTRLVDPLVALYHLRLGAEILALRAFQRIVHDQRGNDTADFLFMPVSNAQADRPGNHWSLLLVDRRVRESPVAYHYDSARGYNDQPAAEFAARLGARLEPARMAQQPNSYDCGVFMVDGTRALVRRLAQGHQPAVLHLDNLVADRQALQNRLRG